MDGRDQRTSKYKNIFNYIFKTFSVKWNLSKSYFFLNRFTCLSHIFYIVYFQLNNPNISMSLLANQLSNLTDVKSGKLLYAGDLKLLVDVIGQLSQRGPGTSKANSLQDTSQTFVKVSCDDITAEINTKLRSRYVFFIYFNISFCQAVVGTASNILDNKNLQSWNYMPRVRDLI